MILAPKCEARSKAFSQYAPAGKSFSPPGLRKEDSFSGDYRFELVVHVKAIWSADNRTNIIFASPLGPVYQPSRFRQLVSPGSGVMTAALIDVGSACRWRLS